MFVDVDVDTVVLTVGAVVALTTAVLVWVPFGGRDDLPPTFPGRFLHKECDAVV